MAHIVTEPCVKCKYTDCVTVCPVDCFHEDAEMLVIDPEVCIDCGACIPECPYAAIFPQDEVPAAYKAKGGEYISMPVGTAGFTTVFDGSDHEGEAVHLTATRVLKAGEVVDLTPGYDDNVAFFKDGPGYDAAK